MLSLVFLHVFWPETLLVFVFDYLFKDIHKANDINIQYVTRKWIDLFAVLDNKAFEEVKWEQK